MKIQIYGTGCIKCTKLMENAQAAINKLGAEADIEKITDINKITDAGVMITPALGVDGKVISAGKVLSADEIAQLLQSGQTVTPEQAACDSRKINVEPAPKGDACCQKTNAKNAGKRILTALLLLLVVGSIAAMVMREMRSAQNANAAVTQDMASRVPDSANVVTVYYFHGNQRCYTCNKIEELTNLAVTSKFPEAVTAGKVVVRSINVDTRENEHYIKDFELTTRGVVIQKGQQYERFDHVWQLAGEPEKFIEYIADGVTKIQNAHE